MRALFLFLLLLLNTALLGLPLLLFTFLKAAVPISTWRTGCTRLLRQLGEGWIFTTNGILRLTGTAWDIEAPVPLKPDSWYLVIGNHQSWVDILAFLHVFGGRHSFPVFFAKKELLRLPLIGAAMWGLDFPFVERYPREMLTRRPDLRGRDLETVRRACEKARRLPTTIIVFPEGTRFTPDKHSRQGSPYRHLLRPRAGGIATALGTLGDRLAGVLDLTVIYPENPPTFLAFLDGRVKRVVVRARALEIPLRLRAGDYRGDPGTRRRFQAWLEGVWREKDDLMESIAGKAPEEGVAGKG